MSFMFPTKDHQRIKTGTKRRGSERSLSGISIVLSWCQWYAWWQGSQGGVETGDLPGEYYQEAASGNSIKSFSIKPAKWGALFSTVATVAMLD